MAPKIGKFSGFIQLPLLVGLLLMVVALPVASRLVSQNQTNQGRATNYKCCQYGCASNCVELSSCDSSHPINCGAVGITGNAMCGSHTSGSSWCEGSNKKSCNNGSIDSQNCGSNGCSNNTCNSAPPPTSAPETQTCAIKTYSGCRGTTHVCNATRQVTIKKTENCPGPDCSADTYDDPSCGYKKPNCVPNTNCCGSTQNAGTCSDGCNGTISCTGAHPPTSTPVLTITPLPTVSVTLKHCCDISNSRCHDQPECGGEYPVELGGGVNATIAPVATPIVCTPLTTCAATTCTTSKCWTGCNNQDGTGIYVAGTLDCAPTIAACTPNSSCASTTCLGQTCTDACNNHYPGTKNCVLSGLDDGVPCTASTCSQCKHGSFADNGSPTGNFCGSARPTASTTTCDGQPLDTTQCAGPDGFNICTSTGWVHHPCASGMQCLGNHCDTAIPSPTPTIELHPGASKVLASPATFEANEKVNTTFSDCQGANMAITVKCVIASTGCTGSSYEAGCVAEKLGCKENPELPACAQISYVRPYSNSPCKQDENSNACQNEKMMNKVAWGVMLAPVAVVAVPVVAAAAPEVAAIGLAAETASTALSSFLYAHGTALAASGGALGTVVTGAGAVVSNPYVQTALTGSAYVAALSVCQQNWYSSDCAAAMAGMNEGGGIQEFANSASSALSTFITGRNVATVSGSDLLVLEGRNTSDYVPAPTDSYLSFPWSKKTSYASNERLTEKDIQVLKELEDMAKKAKVDISFSKSYIDPSMMPGQNPDELWKIKASSNSVTKAIDFYPRPGSEAPLATVSVDGLPYQYDPGTLAHELMHSVGANGQINGLPYTVPGAFVTECQNCRATIDLLQGQFNYPASNQYVKFQQEYMDSNARYYMRSVGQQLENAGVEIDFRLAIQRQIEAAINRPNGQSVNISLMPNFNKMTQKIVDSLYPGR